jgi:hypothetical protein
MLPLLLLLLLLFITITHDIYDFVPETKHFSRGHAVAQLTEALRYRPEGRGFDSRLSHWDFSFT